MRPVFRPAEKIQSEEHGYLRICWHCVYSYFEVFQRQETSFEKSLQLQLWQWQLANRRLNLPEVILLLHLLFIMAEASQQSLLDLIANTRTTKPSIFIYQPSIFMYQPSIFISAWALPKIIFTLMCISLDNSVPSAIWVMSWFHTLLEEVERNAKYRISLQKGTSIF